MPYSDFKTLGQAAQAFGLTVQNQSGLFSNLPRVEPSGRLLDELQEDLDLATAIDTEKARSELIVTPIFKELRRRYQGKLSYFSGSTLNVDLTVGLNGECDFILSASTNQIEISAPILTVVEAKNADTKLGLGQCAAQMVGIMRFNAASDVEKPVWGAATTGDRWRLLRLEGSALGIDLTEYVVPFNLASILGFLSNPFNEIYP